LSDLYSCGAACLSDTLPCSHCYVVLRSTLPKQTVDFLVWVSFLGAGADTESLPQGVPPLPPRSRAAEDDKENVLALFFEGGFSHNTRQIKHFSLIVLPHATHTALAVYVSRSDCPLPVHCVYYRPRHCPALFFDITFIPSAPSHSSRNLIRAPATSVLCASVLRDAPTEILHGCRHGGSCRPKTTLFKSTIF
jgi:hypothetical protein